MIQGIKKSTTSIGGSGRVHQQPRRGQCPPPGARQRERAAKGAGRPTSIPNLASKFLLVLRGPVLQGPSWPQRRHEPSHGDLLDHALANVDVVPLGSDSCRLTTHVLVVLPVLQRTDRVTVL